MVRSSRLVIVFRIGCLRSLAAMPASRSMARGLVPLLSSRWARVDPCRLLMVGPSSVTRRLGPDLIVWLKWKTLLLIWLSWFRPLVDTSNRSRFVLLTVAITLWLADYCRLIARVTRLSVVGVIPLLSRWLSRLCPVLVITVGLVRARCSACRLLSNAENVSMDRLLVVRVVLLVVLKCVPMVLCNVVTEA